jgi:NitT/TauT family transport system substrate-binding protein
MQLAESDMSEVVRGMRRFSSWVVAVAACASYCVPVNVQATDDKPIHVKVAWSSSSSVYLPIVLARDMGIFAKNGLDVETVDMHSGPEFISAMLSGSVDFAGAVADKPLVLKERGQLAKNIVAITAIQPVALVVRSDLPITGFDAKSMKGLKFGVTALRSANDLPLRVLLRTIGVDPTRDVSIVPVGSMAQQLAALEAKQIDGFLSTEPAIALAVAHKTGRVLFDLRTRVRQESATAGVAFSALQATDDYLAKNGEAARRMVKSVLAADQIIAAGDPKAYEAYTKFFKNMPSEVIRSAFDKDKNVFKGEITEQMIKDLVSVELQSGELKQPHPYQDAVWTPSVAIWSK